MIHLRLPKNHKIRLQSREWFRKSIRIAKVMQKQHLSMERLGRVYGLGFRARTPIAPAQASTGESTTARGPTFNF